MTKSSSRRHEDSVLREIGHRIRKARLRLRLDVAEAARRSKTRPEQWKALESGMGLLSIATMVRAVLGLGLSLEQLFSERRPARRAPSTGTSLSPDRG